MNEPTITREQYQAHLHTLSAWIADRHNRGPKATHWQTVRTLMEKHALPEGSTACPEPDCGEVWPCGTIRGAVTDMRMGPAGW